MGNAAAGAGIQETCRVDSSGAGFSLCGHSHAGCKCSIANRRRPRGSGIHLPRGLFLVRSGRCGAAADFGLFDGLSHGGQPNRFFLDLGSAAGGDSAAGLDMDRGRDSRRAFHHHRSRFTDGVFLQGRTGGRAFAGFHRTRGLWNADGKFQNHSKKQTPCFESLRGLCGCVGKCGGGECGCESRPATAGDFIPRSADAFLHADPRRCGNARGLFAGVSGLARLHSFAARGGAEIF